MSKCDPDLVKNFTAMSSLNHVVSAPLSQRTHWGNLAGASFSLLAQSLAQHHQRPIVVVSNDVQSLYQWHHEMQFFQSTSDIPLLIFPDWETLVYDRFSPHQDLVSERLRTLALLPDFRRGIVLVCAHTLMQRLAPREFILAHSCLLKINDKIHLDNFRLRLESLGYQRMPHVYEHGHFSVRGSIIDIFPMGSSVPYRIELFDDEIDSIRTFDPENQRSLTTITSIELLPAREFPFNDEGIMHFRKMFRETFSDKNPLQCPVYTNLSEKIAIAGIEYYLPLFFPQCQTFFDYLPANALIIHLNNMNQTMAEFDHDVRLRYEQRRHDISRPVLAPQQLFLAPHEVNEQLAHFQRIIISAQSNESQTGKITNIGIMPLPHLAIDHTQKIPIHALLTFIKNTTQRIVIVAYSAGRREVLLNLLQEHHIRPQVVENWSTALESTAPLLITTGELSAGFILPEQNIAIITETELVGQQVLQQRRRKKSVQTNNQYTPIHNLAELKLDAPVVHIDHGVGRYAGLSTLTINDQQSEFFCIRYADDDKLYVPITALHLITLYSGANFEHAPLYKLGSKQWERAKEKAAKRAQDIAAELLNIYANRAAKPGFAFKKPDSDYQQFVSKFPFEETPDQSLAITHVLQDMQQTRPMDRLICGDVGFGKTEIAMRAAFLAISNHKQVCVLVPTTLLAQQHYQTFTDRFADFPVQIEVLSRFRSASEQQKIIQKLAKGTIDIIIGTHKLLSKEIQFADLGLMIIDEEHRFGVKQKEHLKALRTEVDILTLTATPIPRSLSMALGSLRDLSIIATPPAKRLSIKTFVHEYDIHLIREAILREIKRGGQVYFLHNDVATIDRITQTLKNAIPEAHIAVAHGQLPERELEKVMTDFYHHRFNTLVCSTIIETGIDIPSANTIIIHRADKLGLAQLHQLRGRVGRSHHQAYAYLLIPDSHALTHDAQKRLEAIVNHEELGVGFTLAMHDLEIRGAGELLGDNQSGNMEEIGFALFSELLEQAVKQMQQNQPQASANQRRQTEITCPITALIPENFMPDVNSRLQYYKRLASAVDRLQLDTIREELVDCYGKIPTELENLFRLTQLKLLAQSLRITKIDMARSYGRIEFHEQPAIDPIKLIKLIQSSKGLYKMQGPQRLYITFAQQPLDIIAWVNDFLVNLM